MADAQQQQQQQQQQYTTTTSETLRGQSQHEQQTSVNGGGPVSSNSRIPPEIAADYDLSKPISSKTGLRQGLAGYGEFSSFLTCW